MEEKVDKIYTYADYLNFLDYSRMEIIEGILYNMSPTPSRVHQEIVLEIATIINNYLKTHNKPCKVYIAPFDVIRVEEEQVQISL